MKNKFLKGLVVSFAFAVSGLANAGLIDYTGFFTDDLTGLDWRDMSSTDGLSYNQVIASTQAGGTNEGYRIATGAEVLNLFNTYIPTSLSTSSSWVDVGAGNGPASIFYDLFGTTYGFGPDPDYRSIIAYTSDISGSRHLTVQLHDYEPGSNGGDIYFGYDRWGYSDDRANSNLGTFLVSQTTAVPEPSTLAVFALGLMGLASRKFKKQA